MQLPIPQRVAQFQAFQARRNPRPLLGFFEAQSEYPLRRFRAAGELPTDRPLRPEDLRPERFLADYDDLHQQHEALGGDFIWSADAFWGIPWLEAALGCPILVNRDSGSIYAEAPHGFGIGSTLPEFDAGNPWLTKAVEFIDTIATHARGRYPIGTTRMRGVADLLAALLGNENMVLAMMEETEAVHRLSRQLGDWWIGFGWMQLERIPLFHGGVGSFYYGMWAPPGTIWHQEDAAALLSPPLYRQFIQPADQRILGAFPHVVMHMHPTGYYPYREFLGTPLLVQELHIDTGGVSAEQLFEVHQQILKTKPLLIWGRLSEADLEWVFSKLPAAGLAIHHVVDSAEEAAATYRRYGGQK